MLRSLLHSQNQRYSRIGGRTAQPAPATSSVAQQGSPRRARAPNSIRKKERKTKMKQKLHGSCKRDTSEKEIQPSPERAHPETGACWSSSRTLGIRKQETSPRSRSDEHGSTCEERRYVVFADKKITSPRSTAFHHTRSPPHFVRLPRPNTIRTCPTQKTTAARSD